MSGAAPGRVAGYPLWLRDIDATLPVTAQYVVHGSIRDRHVVPDEDGRLQLLPTVDALWECLRRSGVQVLLRHTPGDGLSVHPGADAADARTLLGQHADMLGRALGYDELSTVLRAVGTSAAVRGALVIDYLSQAQPAGEPPSEQLHQLMSTALAHVHSSRGYNHPGPRRAQIYNPSFWFVDRPADLPVWMLSGDGIRQVPIPAPDLDARRSAAGLLVPALPAAAVDAALGGAQTHGDEAVAHRFAAATEGMSIRSMIEVVQLAIDAQVPRDRVEDSVRGYRVGLLDNPWKRPAVREAVLDGESFLTERVKGQPRAVRHALDVLVRSATGLTAAHQPRAGTGPRGVLFLAGPTGVGKTELAKAITALVFGDERAYVRFDMSEFAAEHSEARLLGAPPGYVGHGAGGELTNAVRRRPFSLLLFDEVEKASPRILDKFLQILSDGRLTDGSGATVHFTECLIVFTSNLGVAGAHPEGDTETERAASFERQVRAAIEREFRDGINRPELLGRIGDNIIVLDRLSAAVATELASTYLDNVVRRVRAELGIELELPRDVRAALVTEAVADLSTGGRGVGLKLESLLVNPLARALFGRAAGSTATVLRVRRDPSGTPVVDLA